MLIVISPAKTLDLESPVPAAKATKPDFLQDAADLNEELRKLKAADLMKLQSISKDLAELNVVRNHEWALPFTRDNARPAIFTFSGDVYTGLQADSFSREDLEYAQRHLRILSGLYGLLRPLDLMQPYRLEMGTALQNKHGRNLYSFWKDKITQALNKALKAQQDDVLINLASQEYFAAVNQDGLKARIITPVFRDYKNGDYKVLSFFAKKARGVMAAWAIRNRVESVAALKSFRELGYRFSARASSDDELVFQRKQA